MARLYTIGYRGKSLAEFLGHLRDRQISLVVDVRLRNTSQLAGYAKRDDLCFLLEEGFGIAYRHETDLAPTAELLDAYRQTGDWDAYVEAFAPLCTGRGIERLAQEILGHDGTPCLLCSEPTADHCHRRLVSEYWAARWPDLQIEHL